MNTKDIFARVAKQHGTTVADVYSEIQKAIDAGFENTDPDVQAEWRKVKFKGERPTPEEVLAYMVNALQTKRGH